MQASSCSARPEASRPDSCEDAPKAFCGLVGDSPQMRAVFDLIAKVAPTNASVLITGESGTGKELVAAAIHRLSPRCTQPFVSQNCAALNDNLIETELFGHARGAFTGAEKPKLGLFDLADGGTLFLDEVSEMSPALQVKLLRVLQQGSFLPVGGTRPHEVDVRVISATNRPLDELLRAGAFREDLYYRLNVFNIDLPPLRERRGDIPLLARHFLAHACASNGYPLKFFAPEALAALAAYHWPGNVRELENEVQRATILASNEQLITLPHLSARVREAAPDGPRLNGRRLDGPLADALEALERRLLSEGLDRYNWNRSLAARALGISRANLLAKIKKYHLTPPPDAASSGAALRAPAPTP